MTDKIDICIHVIQGPWYQGISSPSIIVITITINNRK